MSDPLADLFDGDVQAVADRPMHMRGGMAEKLIGGSTGHDADPLADVFAGHTPTRGALADAAIQVPAGFNRGLNTVLSAPGALMSWGAQKLGVPADVARKMEWNKPENPVAQFLDNPRLRPETPAGEYVGAASEQVGANVLPSMGITAKAGQISRAAVPLSQPTSTGGQIVRQMADSIAAAPGTAAALDAVSAASAGLAGHSAKEAGYGPTAQGLAQIAGGFVAPVGYGLYGMRNAAPATGAQPALGTPVGRNISAERASAAAEDLAAFQELGVRPFGPAFSTPAGRSIAKQISETPLIGAPVANALDESTVGARNVAASIADRMSPNATYENAGQTLQSGLERFRTAGVGRVEQSVLEDGLGINPLAPVQSPVQMSAGAAQRIADAQGFRTAQGFPINGSATTSRGVAVPAARPLNQTYLTRRGASDLDHAELDRLIQAPPSQTSFAVRQEALYESAERARPALFRSNGAVDPGQLSPVNTRDALQQITDQIANQISGQGTIRGELADRLMNYRSSLSMDNLRNIRTEVGRSLSNYGVGEAALDRTQLKSLYAAISRDMEVGFQDLAARAWRNAADAGNPQNMVEVARQADSALFQFRRADRYTRLGIENMDRFQSLLDAKSPEAAARKLVSATLADGKGNLGMIRSARAALRPEEWSQFQALITREMGTPTASARGAAQELGFSTQTFLTNWRKMDPVARAAVFTPEHRGSLELLSRVVSRLANVEATMNTSRSATNALNISMLFGTAKQVASGDLISPVAMGAAGTAMSYLMSRPAYANWAVRYANLRSAVLGLPMNTLYGAGSPMITGPAMSAHITLLSKWAKEDPVLGDALKIVQDENADLLRGSKPPMSQPGTRM